MIKKATKTNGLLILLGIALVSAYFVHDNRSYKVANNNSSIAGASPIDELSFERKADENSELLIDSANSQLTEFENGFDVVNFDSKPEVITQQTFESVRDQFNNPGFATYDEIISGLQNAENEDAQLYYLELLRSEPFNEENQVEIESLVQNFSYSDNDIIQQLANVISLKNNPSLMLAKNKIVDFQQKLDELLNNENSQRLQEDLVTQLNLNEQDSNNGSLVKTNALQNEANIVLNNIAQLALYSDSFDERLSAISLLMHHQSDGVVDIVRQNISYSRNSEEKTILLEKLRFMMGEYDEKLLENIFSDLSLDYDENVAELAKEYLAIIKVDRSNHTQQSISYMDHIDEEIHEELPHEI